MQVGLRHFDSQTLDWLAGALRSGDHSRHSLSRGLCERTGWRDASGRPRLSAAAKALPVLAGRLGLDLPAARGGPGRRSRGPGRSRHGGGLRSGGPRPGLA